MDRSDENAKGKFVRVEQHLSNACGTSRKTVQVGSILDLHVKGVLMLSWLQGGMGSPMSRHI